MALAYGGIVKKALIAFCAMFLFASNAVCTETLPNEDAAKGLAAKIMTKVIAGDLDAVFKIMTVYSSLGPTEIDRVATQAKVSRDQSKQRYGSSTGYKFIDSKKAGDSMLRIRYIEETEKNALLLWVFYFNKPKDGWIMNSFSWSEDYKALFNDDSK